MDHDYPGFGKSECWTARQRHVLVIYRASCVVPKVGEYP
jgi:hypothetical protein